MVKTFLKQNGIYIFIYFALLIYIANILLDEDKVDIHRNMNAYVGNYFIGQLFAYVTHLGDGLFAVIIAVLISFKNVRVGLYILLSYVAAGIVSYILKHWIYHDVFRPHFVFQYTVREELNLVDGVDVLAHHSFPSGHALSAFALFFCLLFVTKSHLLKTVYLLLAFIAAYSRIHLSQHWLIDIYVGSIIGFLFSVLFYFVFYLKKHFPQLNTTLPKLFSKNNNTSV